jgi:plasmid stabilization system protein ParE
MARLTWSLQAAEAVCAFIARDSERYASQFGERVWRSVEVLREFPGAGRVVPEFGDSSLRELLIGNYRIIYEITEDGTEILTIHHGSRILRRRP